MLPYKYLIYSAILLSTNTLAQQNPKQNRWSPLESRNPKTIKYTEEDYYLLMADSLNNTQDIPLTKQTLPQSNDTRDHPLKSEATRSFYQKED